MNSLAVLSLAAGLRPSILLLLDWLEDIITSIVLGAGAEAGDCSRGHEVHYAGRQRCLSYSTYAACKGSTSAGKELILVHAD